MAMKFMRESYEGSISQVVDIHPQVMSKGRCPMSIYTHVAHMCGLLDMFLLPFRLWGRAAED